MLISLRAKSLGSTYFFVCLWLALFLVSSGFGQQAETNLRKRRIADQTSTILSKNNIITQSKLKIGEKHNYEIKLTQGEYLHLAVIKNDADVVATLFDPNNKQLIKVASTDRPQDPEVGIFVLVEVTGTYTLTIMPSPLNPNNIVSYGLKVKDIHLATKDDKIRITLHSAYSEAERLRLENTKESLQKAFSLYTEILPQWKQVNDLEGEGATLNAISTIYYNFGQYQESLQTFEQSLKIWQQQNNPLWEVATLNAIGTVCNVIKENRRALYYHLKAQQIANKLKDPQWLILSLNGLGKTCTDLGEYQQALNYYQQVRTLKKSLGDKRGEAISLSNIANIYTTLQDHDNALAYHKEALAIFKSVGDTTGEASTLNNLGRSYMLLGNYDDSLEEFEKALDKKRSIADLRGEATTFNNIGYLYMVRSEQKNNRYFIHATYFGYIYKTKALEKFKQAVSIWQKINDPVEEQTSLSLIAKTYKSLGDNKSVNEVSQQILALDKYIKNLKSASESLVKEQTYKQTTEQTTNNYNTNNLPINNSSASNSNKSTTNLPTNNIDTDNSISKNSITSNSSSQNSQTTPVVLPKIQTIPISELPSVSRRKTSEKTQTKASKTASNTETEKTDRSVIDKKDDTAIATNKKETTVNPTPTTKIPNQIEKNESITEKLSTGKGNFSIQVGALSKREEAEVLSNQLRNSGLPSYVAEGNAGGKTVFRVRMGRFTSMEEAKKVAAQLKAKGAIKDYFVTSQ